MRLQEAFESFLAYMEHERRAAPSALVGYRTDLDQYLHWLDQALANERAAGVAKPPILRPNALGHFTTERVRAWQASLAIERKIGVAAVRRKLHALRAFSKFCVRVGALGHDPMTSIVVPKKRKRVQAGLALEHLQQVMALPLPSMEAAMRGIFALAGLRREEVLTLTVGRVRLEPGHPTLLVRGKGDKERLVPIPPPLRDLLLDYLLRTGKTGPRELLFTTMAGEPLHPSRCHRIVAKWGRAVGIHLHPHLFRHSYATGLVADGIPLPVVQEWLGHEDLATTAIYLHAAHTRSAMDGLAAWAQTILASEGFIPSVGATRATQPEPHQERPS